MSQLSPSARRIVDLAVAAHAGPQDQSAWDSWINYSDREFPAFIVQIAENAIRAMRNEIEQTIDAGQLSSMAIAQLENDLGYISDIEDFFTESAYEVNLTFA